MKGFWVGFAVLAVSVLAATGCGKAHRSGGDSAGNDAAAGQVGTLNGGDFRFQVVSADSKDPALPATTVTASQMAWATDFVVVNRADQSTEISYRKRLLISAGGERLFFVFGEKAFGSKIQDAFYSGVRSQDSANRVSGELQRLSAAFDSDSKRWFIPIPTNLNINDHQLLEIELHLADGSRKEVLIRFDVTYSLPQNLDLPANVQKFVPAATVSLPDGNRSLDDGWIYATDQFFNPTSRVLRILLAPGKSMMISSTWINGDFIADYKKEFLRAYRSEAKFEHAGVVLIHGNPLNFASTARKEVRNEKNEVSVDILPGEVLEVRWIARPVEGTPACSAPAQRSLPSKACHGPGFTIENSYRFPWESCPGDFELVPNIYRQQLQIQGIEMDGWVSRQVRLVEEGGSASVVLRDKKDEALSVLRGEKGRMDAVPFECQGVF